MNVDAPECAPPIYQVSRPKLVAPKGACDTHAHVFGNKTEFPLAPTRGYTPPPSSLHQLFEVHDVLGIERAVLTQPSVYGTDNSALIDSLKMGADRLRGVAAVGADVTDQELDELADLGVAGVRINIVDKGGMPFASLDAVKEFSERLPRLDWHIEFLAHVDLIEDFDFFGRLAAPCVFGHFGYMKSDEGAKSAGFCRFLRAFEKGHIWVKMTAPYRITRLDDAPYKDVDQVAEALLETRPDRLLWGTDWPHVINPKPMVEDGRLFDELDRWLPSEESRRQVLVANPCTLYKFPPL